MHVEQHGGRGRHGGVSVPPPREKRERRRKKREEKALPKLPGRGGVRSDFLRHWDTVVEPEGVAGQTSVAADDRC